MSATTEAIDRLEVAAHDLEEKVDRLDAAVDTALARRDARMSAQEFIAEVTAQLEDMKQRLTALEARNLPDRQE